MGEGDENSSTELKVKWIDPVETVGDLPLHGVREGSLCIVTTEQTVYEFRAGSWAKEVVMDVDL